MSHRLVHPDRVMPTGARQEIVVRQMDGPGAKFWLKMAGVLLLGGIVVFIFLAIFVKAVFAWGILAALLLVALLAAVARWFVDRRNAGARS